MSDWCDIPNYSKYEMNRFSRIRGKKSKKVKKQFIDKFGFIRCNKVIDDNGKSTTPYVYKLYQEVFLKNVIEEEQWYDIPNFPRFEIKRDGSVRNKETLHLLSMEMRTRPNSPDHPYSCVCVSSEKGKGKQTTTLHIHRVLATLFVPNPDNKSFVDHVNGNTLDNRIENLRWATSQENSFNCKTYKNNMLNVKGVQLRYGKYRARIRHNNTLINLGTFDTLEEAKEAYINKAEELFGQFATDRK